MKLIVEKRKMLSDIITPVSLYMKIRNKYSQSALLESSDYQGVNNSMSYIAFSPMAQFVVENNQIKETDIFGKNKITKIDTTIKVSDYLNHFRQEIKISENDNLIGLFGYTAYNSIQYFDTLKIKNRDDNLSTTPEMIYTFFRYVIRINHFNNELTVIENIPNNEISTLNEVISLIKSKKFTEYEFKLTQNEISDTSPEQFLEMIDKGKKHCRKGDVFQIVLSRQFSRQFQGDDFNVYRALRKINPSPYLFYFDFASFKLFGSSPEAQITVSGNKATLNPIAGTFKRTGDDEADRLLAEKLSEDKKETAEHIMLVDLARNDLGKSAKRIDIETFKEVQYYSHVLHLVSTVSGTLNKNTNPIQVMADTFPAGTLSGAPKYKAMQLIDQIEQSNRGFYGGTIGFIGLNGDINSAILIRSFLSKNNCLIYRAGAGIVDKSDKQSELQEVDNKIGALREALKLAETI